jgi:hypothetical protein
MRQEVIQVRGDLYQVHRIISADIVEKVEDGVKLLTEYWYCDRAFKNKNKYYFVRDITEINYEEIT